MKKLYFLSITCSLLAFATNIKAQSYIPIPDSNAIWTVGERYGGYPPPNGYHDKYYTNGDTTINNIKYKKIFLMSVWDFDSITSIKYLAALRYEANKWFFVPPTSPQEKLLYDFNLNTGDSITVYSWRSIRFYYYQEPIPTTLHVYYTDSVMIDNNWHKRLKLYPSVTDEEIWIEGIGSLSGLFLAGCGIWLDGGYWLLCFKEQGVIKYCRANYETSCEDLNGIEIPAQNAIYTDIQIYPCPFADKVEITLTDINDIIINITIYDVYTTTVFSESFFGKSLTCDLNKLSTGIYTIIASTKKKKYIIKKIIKL